MVSCRGSMAKAILCTLNLMFILLAFSAILFGTQMPNSDQFTWGMVPVPGAVIILGVVVGIISIFGFGAALCESAMLLNVYVYFLTLCTLSSIAVTVIFLLFNGFIIKNMRNEYQRLMSEAKYMSIQNFQYFFYCCGLDSPNDWKNQTFGNSTLPPDTYPSSCCGKMIETEPTATCPGDQLLSHDGCFSPIQIQRYKILVEMISLMIILMLGLLLSLACCLERDRCLQLALLVNLQYAAHLSNCRQPGTGLISSWFSKDSTVDNQSKVEQKMISRIE